MLPRARFSLSPPLGTTFFGGDTDMIMETSERVGVGECQQSWMQDLTAENCVLPQDAGPDKMGHRETLRVTWSTKTEYFLSMIGYCVGLGNIWRFPYICIRNGGGAFLIAYVICLVLCGIPLFLMDVSMAQFTSRGAYHIWSICPLFRGIGVGQIMCSVISSWYYVLLIAWVLIYLGHSFRSPLPWTLCGQTWNTPDCAAQGRRGQQLFNETSDRTTGAVNGTSVTGQDWASVNFTDTTLRRRTSAEEFWLNNVLELSPGLENLNGLPWHSTLALFVAGLLVFLCIVRGVKSVGKVVYVTATMPYILLTILIIKGFTLEGAIDGVIFYIKPDFSKLILMQTWLEASIQVFYSLGPVCGTLVTMASYNKFHNNCLRDSVVLSFISEGTSVYAGLAIFTVLGHMAHNLDVHVSNFTAAGPGLAFVVYPEALAYLPVPHLWSVLFFLMLFTVALDTQFVAVEVIMTSLQDFWPKLMAKRGIIVKILFCSAQFLLGLPLATRGGIYLFQLVDWYLPAFAIAAMGFLQCLAVAWIYGADRFMNDIEFMIGRRPPIIFSLLWSYVTPVLLLILLVTSLMSYKSPDIEGYQYGIGAIIFGWAIAVVWFLPVPILAVGQLVVARGHFINRLKATCRPTSKWQPGDVNFRNQYKQWKRPPDRCQLKIPIRLPCFSDL